MQALPAHPAGRASFGFCGLYFAFPDVYYLQE